MIMAEQILLSPQVKWSVIISNKLVQTSYLTICPTNYDWGSWEIGKYQEISKLHGIIA